MVDVTTESLIDIVQAATLGRGAYAALDAVGGTSTGLLASCIRPNGLSYCTLACPKRHLQ